MFRYLLSGVLLLNALPAWADVSAASPLKSQEELQKLKEQRREMRQRNAKAARDPVAWGVVRQCRATMKAAKTPQDKAAAATLCQQGAAWERERLDLQR
jgi:hypothetical protein